MKRPGVRQPRIFSRQPLPTAPPGAPVCAAHASPIDRASLTHLLVCSKRYPITPMLNRPRDRHVLVTLLALAVLVGGIVAVHW